MTNNTKIILFSVFLGLFWSSPALRTISTGGATMVEIWLSVIIRILIIFAAVKFIVSIATKAKK